MMETVAHAMSRIQAGFMREEGRLSVRLEGHSQSRNAPCLGKKAALPILERPFFITTKYRRLSVFLGWKREVKR